MIPRNEPHKPVTIIQMSLLTLLRVAVGWHFLYEGIAKIFTPGWTSQGFLSVSKWLFAPVFRWIADTPNVLSIVDFINVWGLILVGLGLIAGLLTRVSAIFAIVLLSLYYIANPPFIGMDYGVVTEGNYLVVDKNLVELVALIVIALFPTGTFLGLDRLIQFLRTKRSEMTGQKQVKEKITPVPEIHETPPSMGRRELLTSLASMPVFGIFVILVLKKLGWESYEEKHLEQQQADAVSSATIKTFNFSSLENLKGQVPHTKIKNLELSRIILGGNLITGFVHARDLIYVSKLVKAYHHKTKIFETFMLAEKCGINAFLTNPMLSGVINEYWRRGIGNIKFIPNTTAEDIIEGAKKSIDYGASACYVHGAKADSLAREGNIEPIARAVDLIRQNGIPAGIGAHDLYTIKKCVESGIEPDFWLKTLHNIDYWSARPEGAKEGLGDHDNLWCSEPEATIEFMRKLPQPWIAFKVLAAGAIAPEVGFKYAFDGGADFLCVGMYDFQIVDDVNIALNVLGSELNRKRPWYA
ncbi:MAG: DoxX family protein [Candidatus Latescibacteria bacterium]|nr:DoxX family protein [Candidatus Latescibacterota bacterium]